MICLSDFEYIARACEEIEIQQFFFAVFDEFYLIVSVRAGTDAFDIENLCIGFSESLFEHFELRFAVFPSIVGDEEHTPEKVIYLRKQQFLLPSESQIMVAQEENIGVV